jgi:hypothetical protein
MAVYARRSLTFSLVYHEIKFNNFNVPSIFLYLNKKAVIRELADRGAALYDVANTVAY